MFLSNRLRDLIFRVRHRLGKTQRDSLRAMMRGYRVLKRSSNLQLIQDLHKVLRETPPAIDGYHYSTVIFGASHSVAELVIRQTLAQQENCINQKLLEALGREGCAVVLPLPSCWLKEIGSRGFRVGYLRSSMFLFANGLKHLALGVAQVGVSLARQFTFLSERLHNREPFVYFCDLEDTNLPQPIGNSKSYCIVNWYRQWQGRNKAIRNIRHGVKGYADQRLGDVQLEYQRRPLPPLAGVSAIIGYIFWAIKAIAISLFDLLRGRWWHAMLLREASFAALVRYGDKGSLARQYFFHNSRFYPPLWTYELPCAGSEAIFYWYSTNSEPFQRADGSRPFTTPYSLVNWPRYLVWDEAQADFVRRCQGIGSNIEVVGPIWFQDNGVEIIGLNRPVIAVFDVQPHRASRYCRYSLPTEFYVPPVVNAFLLDIAKVASSLNASLAIKRKRDIGKLAHPSYVRCLDLIMLESSISVIDSGVSAFRLIEKADIIISMPFTSTAHSARQAGKPSIYYHPSFLFSSEDPAAHGIPVVQGREALKDWLRTEIDVLLDNRLSSGIGTDCNAHLNL